MTALVSPPILEECVLIVEPDPGRADELRRMLEPGRPIRHSADLGSAEERLHDVRVAVVVADASVAPSLRDWVKRVSPEGMVRMIRTGERSAPPPLPDNGPVLLRPFAACELRALVEIQLELARVRREARDRVQESEERFRHVADRSPLMFWVTDATGHCTYLNPRWHEFTGQTPEQALGFGWTEALHPEDRARVKEEFIEANARQAEFRSEYRLRRYDGAFRWMLDSAAPRVLDQRFAGYVGSVLDITEERSERDRLSRERRQMAMALQAGRIGAFEWDIPTGRIHWSPELELLYEIAPGSFEGTFRGWTQRVVEEDVHRVEEIVRHCFEHQIEEIEYEFRARLPGGAQRWLEGKARFTFGPNGAPRLMTGINLDIDDRKHAELNAAFLQRLAHEVALTASAEEILTLTCRGLGEHLGVTRCFFVASEPGEISATIDSDWAAEPESFRVAGTQSLTGRSAEFWKALRTGIQVVENSERHLRERAACQAASDQGMAAWASAPHMREGHWVASLVIAADRPRRWRPDEIKLLETVLARTWPQIERVRSVRAVIAAEAKIRESEERLRVAIQAARLGTWDVGAATGEWVCDARGRELFGLEADEALSWDRILSRIHPDDRTRVEQGVMAWRGVDDAGEFDLEARFRRLGGTDYRWVRASGKVLFNELGLPIRSIGTLHDITDVVQARETQSERSLELERLVAERTSRLEDTVAELEGFSYSISHDLRAPLRAMQSFAQILANECGDRLDDAGHDYLRRIIRASERMDRLIHDVLVYSRVSRTELVLGPVDLDQLVRGIVESYPQFRPEVADIILRAPLPRVLGNEAALTQCLSNLLGNAVKFVAPGTRPRVEVWADIIDGRARIHIRDNGIGIAPEWRDRIFGIFERRSRAYDGTGIGLAVVRKAVERMGGSVSLAGSSEQGSTFCLELPSAP